MSSKVNVGVVGYGYWGPNMVRNFFEAPGADLRGVCESSSDRLTKVENKYPSVRLYDDYDQMLRESDIDAVCIATPMATHYSLAMKALRAGKHVLIEKPMASGPTDGRELQEAAEERALTLMVDHTFIYTGAVRKIRGLIASGEIGEVYYYDGVRVNLGLFQHDVNVLYDLAIHDLSIMDFVLGEEPVAVSATGMAHVANQPENMAYVTLFFERSILAHIHVNWLAPVKIRRTLIGGSHKMIVYDDLEPSEKIRVYDKGVDVEQSPESIHKMLISYRTGDAWIPKVDTTEALSVAVSHFVDCVRTGKEPLSGASVGLRMLRILEAATKSMKRRGHPVELGPA